MYIIDLCTITIPGECVNATSVNVFQYKLDEINRQIKDKKYREPGHSISPGAIQ